MDSNGSCPNCGRIDWVQSMPAIASTGISSTYGSGTYAGVGVGPFGGVFPVVGSATMSSVQMTALAAATRLAPPRRSLTGPAVWSLLGFAVALFIVSVFGASVALSPSAGSGVPMMGLIVLIMFGVVPFVAPTLVAFVVLVQRVRSNARVVRGLPAATVLWRTGFYCHRCAVCFWMHSPAAGISARQPLSPYQFQRIVWSVGGY